jgi:hypothetical protein
VQIIPVLAVGRVESIHAREQGSVTDPKAAQMSYPESMDHLNALREKIGRLRAEIADIQKLNVQFRLRERNEPEAQVAHGQRQERLQAIQQELAQLAGLGRKVLSFEGMNDKHRYRLHVVKKAS